VQLWHMLLSAIELLQQPTGGVSSQLLQRLQVTQNAAAHLVTGVRRSEHITPILRDLHWLPVQRRITIKSAVVVYKCLHNMAPHSTFRHTVSRRQQLPPGVFDPLIPAD